MKYDIYNTEHFLGKETTLKQADVVLCLVPWELTITSKAGTAKAPKEILKASCAIDSFDPNYHYQPTIYTNLSPYSTIKKINSTYFSNSQALIDKIEKGKMLSKTDITTLEDMNKASKIINQLIKDNTHKCLSKNQIPAIIGGDHSSPYGQILTIQKTEPITIIHIDAHMDLRQNYYGFEFSHASIMYNVEQLPNVKKIIQIGVRDFCSEEKQYADNSEKIHSITDYEISEQLLTGKNNWHELCQMILNNINNKVYISLDVDGLTLENCPNTGTPVPGGLTYQQVVYLIKQIANRHTIVGFDVCETGNDHIDCVVSAKLINALCYAAFQSKHNTTCNYL